MKHRTAELEGALLDAAVAKAEGLQWRIGRSDYYEKRLVCYVDAQHETRDDRSSCYGPTSYWDQGGPIIERERISLIAPDDRPEQLADPLLDWMAEIERWDDNEDETISEANGKTPLIAAMRAYVASKFGEEIEL